MFPVKHNLWRRAMFCPCGSHPCPCMTQLSNNSCMRCPPWFGPALFKETLQWEEVSRTRLSQHIYMITKTSFRRVLAGPASPCPLIRALITLEAISRKVRILYWTRLDYTIESYPILWYATLHYNTIQYDIWFRIIRERDVYMYVYVCIYIYINIHTHTHT